MTTVRNVLVVGGGIAGMSAAIMLRRAGLAVDLVDIDPEWRVYGAGITITGPTLRAFKALGILGRVMAEGHTNDDLNVCARDGTLIAQIKTPRLEPDVPGAGGILRPVLHTILSGATLALGTTVRLGLTVGAILRNDSVVDVRFSDGTTGTYDLVIGADGIFSRMRELLFPEAPRPAYTGQACWRLLIDRPPDIDRRHFFLGGPVKVGVNPVSRREMYMFLLEHVPEKQRPEPAAMPDLLHRLLDGYGGVLAQIRRQLSANSRIVYRPLEAALLPRPWSSGRVILIGDAVHATTPQLASGAGLSVEDALVLSEEIQRHPTLEAAFEAHTMRRFARCRLVVENSLEIGRLEVAGAAAEQQAAVVETSLRALAQPI